MMNSPIKTRLQTRNDRLEVVRTKHKSFLAERGEENLSDTDRQQIDLYRTEQKDLLAEIESLTADSEAEDRAEEMSRKIRQAGLHDADLDGDQPVYRTMAEYARDVILTSPFQTAGMISQHVDKGELERSRARLDLLQRTPANTLSSNVGGLTPAQHIAQIFQVIDKSRNLVSAATRTELNRGTLTYPVVTTPPVVAVQASQKTEGGNTGMVIDMVTATASTYLGGGDLSWQAINWSTPNALDLWFRLVAADYALKTETDAATVVSSSAFINNAATVLGATPTFAQFMTAVGSGYTEVFTNSGRTANTLIMAPDRYGYILGTTSDAFAQFTTVSGGGVGPLNIVVSRGLNSGEIIVGDMAGLLVAETPGAPVELRVVEPAIGGVEVGLIGAFEAVVVDDGAFASITTAS